MCAFRLCTTSEDISSCHSARHATKRSTFLLECAAPMPEYYLIGTHLG